ncbi:MAG TPA: hypothetical protein VKY31_01020 [Terriglobia bacterium]|nr:hypothetical protein [Terriglobia bacterium]
MEEEDRNHGARKLIVAISFYDLGQRKPSSEELVEMAKRFNYEAGAAFLARLNVCLSLAIASSDENIFAAVHEKLTASVLSRARLQDALSAFGDKLYRTAIVLNRTQILAGIKLLALYAPREGGSTLETEEDRYQVGEFVLAINSFYGPDLGEPNWPLDDVSAQLAASAELNNPELILNGLVRTRCLLGPVLDDYLQHLKGQVLPPFERIFTLLNGLNFRDFLDLTLYLHMEHSRMLDELMSTDEMAYVDVREPKRYVSGEKLKSWAELMAISLEDAQSSVSGSEADLAFFFDVTMFRRFPLWRSGNYRYFLIDPIFMAERLSSYGFYWTVVNGLVDDHLRSQFQSLWGELVQEYVRQLLAESFSAEADSFLRRPTYSDDGSEVFDCAVLVGDGLIPIEIKGSVLPIADRYAAKAGPFYQGISEKFGSGPGAAVEQLLRNIEHIFSAEHPRECSQIPSGRIRRILPIIIVHEPIFRFGALARTLATEFTAGLKRLVKKIRPSVEPFYIYPFQVLTVEELERLQPYIQERDFDLFDCVRSKAKEDPDYRLGLWEFITTRFLPAKRIKPRANEKMIGRFEWLTEAQSWRVYRGDYYDHSLAERRKATDYAIISARPVGGDKLLWDEVIAYKEYPTAGEAYKAIRAIADSAFPKQPISADWFECQVVDEFGVPIEEPE